MSVAGTQNPFNIADTRVVTAASSESATLAGANGAYLRTANF